MVLDHTPCASLAPRVPARWAHCSLVGHANPDIYPNVRAIGHRDMCVCGVYSSGFPSFRLTVSWKRHGFSEVAISPVVLTKSTRESPESIMPDFPGAPCNMSANGVQRRLARLLRPRELLATEMPCTR